MKLPSGQLLLSLFEDVAAASKKFRGNKFVKSLLSNTIADDAVSISKSLGFSEQSALDLAFGAQAKPRYHGTYASNVRHLSDVDPQKGKSELLASYFSTKKQLASKFGNFVIEGEVPRRTLLNLHKPLTPSVVKAFSAATGKPEEELWGLATQQARKAGRLAVLGKRGKYLVKNPTSLPSMTPNLGQRPTSGHLLSALTGGTDMPDPSRYGHRADATRLLKSAGFEGSEDLDWYYTRGAGKQGPFPTNRTKYPETHYYDKLNPLRPAQSTEGSRALSRRLGVLAPTHTEGYLHDHKTYLKKMMGSLPDNQYRLFTGEVGGETPMKTLHPTSEQKAIFSKAAQDIPNEGLGGPWDEGPNFSDNPWEANEGPDLHDLPNETLPLYISDAFDSKHIQAVQNLLNADTKGLLTQDELLTHMSEAMVKYAADHPAMNKTHLAEIHLHWWDEFLTQLKSNQHEANSNSALAAWNEIPF